MEPVPPEFPGTARIVAIANQKGGVGKSTTAVSLGAALADIGYRVLVVDLDPQGNASTGMGIRHEARETTVYEVVVAEASIEDAIVHTPIEGLHAVPSTIDLAGAEIELVSQFSRETRLKRALQPVGEGRYDFVLLDCPPSLGLLTVNALTAAEELIVPIQCEYYALEGLGQLLRNVNLVQQNINPELRLSGIVMTMFDPRTKLSEQVVAEVRRFFGEIVYDVIIPRTVRLSEAPGFGQPITVYDPRSKGAETYRSLAREVALRPPPEAPMPAFDDLPTVMPVQLRDDVPLAPEPDLASEPEPLPTPEAEPVPEPAPEPAPRSAEVPS
ncbi:MAG TPA: AAA family ATPase, partial [Actinomycetota bacterium]|nr:AAA family ATPase [Actinomycetota bacterium]